MRTLSALVLMLVLVVSACGGTGAATPGQPTTGTPTIAPAQTAGAVATQSAQGGGGVTALPAACAAGFIAYLKLIEPDAAKLNATATLKDFDTVDRAVQEKGVEAMGNPAALYDCSSAGIEFAYFDSNTPWDTLMAVASKEAPGTVGYFTALKEKRASDVRKMADYGATSCDDAVAKIKQRVKSATGAGARDVGGLDLFTGLSLLGLYDTYLHEVQNDACPKDALGNDEFNFFGAY